MPIGVLSSYITYLKPEKMLKSPQKLGDVTIFSYICNRIHKECGK